MKYSEFLQLVIDTIPEYLIHTELNYFYICPILDYIQCNKEVQALHIAKLRKTVKTKMKDNSTLGSVIGYSNEARINWLNTLVKYHASRGN